MSWDGTLPFTPTNGSTHYLIGGIVQRIDFPWTPGGGYELDKVFSTFDMANRPFAGEQATLRLYASESSGNVELDGDYQDGDAVKLAIPLDSGLSEGLNLGQGGEGRAGFYSLVYIGEQQLEIYEVAIRGELRGGERGASTV